MPVNFQEIQRQVHDFGEKAAKRQGYLDNLRKQMLALLEEYACQQDELREKVKRALTYNPGLRCAVPTQEILNARFPTPELPPQVTLLAADGSQITPSRHDQVEFCVINVGNRSAPSSAQESLPPRSSRAGCWKSKNYTLRKA